jgi:hypothetical protein
MSGDDIASRARSRLGLLWHKHLSAVLPEGEIRTQTQQSGRARVGVGAGVRVTHDRPLRRRRP